jgi:dihydrofolate reductase
VRADDDKRDAVAAEVFVQLVGAFSPLVPAGYFPRPLEDRPLCPIIGLFDGGNLTDPDWTGTREQEYAMAELTLTTFMTLDGVMQAPGGPHEDTSGNFRYGGWLVPHADADMVETMVEIFAKASAFLLGRRTYDIFSSYWPAITDPDNPIAVRLNTLPKFIASQSRADFSWDGSSHIDDVVGGVADLKSRFEGEVQVHGSCGLAQTLIENDLIDEYRLLTFPVVLGTGKRLFGVGAVPTALSLARCKTTSKGVVVAAYRRAGPLETGSFAVD